MSEPENAPLPLIRHALLRDQVYNLLRTQVLDGTLPPGSRLVEDELAERLGASRTPVREAMHRLMVEGLVVASKGRGLEVADVGPQELKEAIEIRLLLEKYAIGFAARLAAPEEIEQLRETCRLEKEYLREHPEKHLSELFQLNRNFHQQLVRCAHNQTLNYIVSQLLNNSVYRFYALGDLQNLHKFAASHLHLVDAIERHDVQAAEAEITYHLELMGSILSPEIDET